ncbi:glycosyltransferase family 2 protein [Cellulomonas sp. SG140]|uniref:glycosyltransferase family 2 protein n=1 Tax=Cellulomonas sp. SG140 TaxID=2976536 RepID=UPI0021E712DE|nr:glycosyltransferase family 2 protein [Cellulomonas sp. SG140]
MSTPIPAVRVVCVVYHPGPELARFADGLRTASSRPFELVLVDNGDDQTVSRAVADEHGARLVVPGRNLGYGAAANVGAMDATAEWLVVANSDLEWPAGSLDRLLDVAAAHPEAGAVGPALLNTDGTVYPSARELPSLTQGVGHAVLGRVWPGNPWTRAYQARQETVGVQRAAGWLSGACLVLRRRAFEQVGGFDEDYFMFFEDVDLGERLGAAGWVNLYAPQVAVTHIGGTSWRSRPAPMIRAHHASAWRYLSRRYTGWRMAPVRLVLRSGLWLREQVELRAAR